jgi:hypothetical protein
MFVTALFGGITMEIDGLHSTLERIPVSFLDSLLVLSCSYPPTFPTMDARELAGHIRSSPAELVLDKQLRFRHRTFSIPCDFSEFLQALQYSETMRTNKC